MGVGQGRLRRPAAARCGRAAAARPPRRPRRRRRTPARREGQHPSVLQPDGQDEHVRGEPVTAQVTGLPARVRDAAPPGRRRPDDRAARSRCRACCGRRRGRAARRPRPRRPVEGRSSSSASRSNVPQRSDLAVVAGVDERPAPHRVRPGAAGPADGLHADPRRAGARASRASAVARIEPRVRSPRRPQGPGCSTSSSRAAGNAVPSIGSPRSWARSAHRSRVSRGCGSCPDGGGHAGQPPTGTSDTFPQQSAGRWSAGPSSSRPGRSAGANDPAAQHRLDRVGRRRPAAVTVRSSRTRRISLSSCSQPHPQARRAGATAVSARSIALGRGQLRQRADRLADGCGASGRLERPRPRRSTGRPAAAAAARRAVAARCWAEHGRVGEVDAHRQGRRAARRRPARPSSRCWTRWYRVSGCTPTVRWMDVSPSAVAAWMVPRGRYSASPGSSTVSMTGSLGGAGRDGVLALVPRLVVQRGRRRPARGSTHRLRPLTCRTNTSWTS